jgi:hypothetical protein
MERLSLSSMDLINNGGMPITSNPVDIHMPLALDQTSVVAVSKSLSEDDVAAIISNLYNKNAANIIVDMSNKPQKNIDSIYSHYFYIVYAYAVCLKFTASYCKRTFIGCCEAYGRN